MQPKIKMIGNIPSWDGVVRPSWNSAQFTTKDKIYCSGWHHLTIEGDKPGTDAHLRLKQKYASAEFRAQQQLEPYRIMPLGSDLNYDDACNYAWRESVHISCWVYRDQILQFEVARHRPVAQDEEQIRLLVKHHVLRDERWIARIQRVTEALENIANFERNGTSREPIPQSVQLFVWQRDQGRCVKCGSKEKLEYDHIVPLSRGGSNSARNIQLSCETCNRSKGSAIGG